MPGGQGVHGAIHRAAVYYALSHIAHIDGPGLEEGGQVGQHAALGILVQILIVHLDDVGHQSAGNLGGQLAPVAVPGGELGLHGDVGVLFLKLFDGGHGQVVTGLGTPPGHPQGNGLLLRAGGGQGRHGHAQQHGGQQNGQHTFHCGNTSDLFGCPHYSVFHENQNANIRPSWSLIRYSGKMYTRLNKMRIRQESPVRTLGHDLSFSKRLRYSVGVNPVYLRKSWLK